MRTSPHLPPSTQTLRGGRGRCRGPSAPSRAPRGRVAATGGTAEAWGGVELYGAPGSRSPLVDWYLYECGVEFTLRDPREASNPHPFSQVPALRDGGLEVWESGAILMYVTHAP